MKPVYKRILLKLSGEVLAGESGKGIDFDTVKPICEVIKACADMGVQIGIVVGGGNFWRGRSSGAMDRTRADQMGMLATVINCLALQEALIQEGNDAVVMTALDIQRVARPFNKDEAVRLHKDPNKFADAVKYDTLTYDEILEKHLGVMDNTAAALAGNSRLPVLVFNLNDPANIKKAVLGENIGTVVK